MKPEILQMCAGPVKSEMVGYSGGEVLCTNKLGNQTLNRDQLVSLLHEFDSETLVPRVCVDFSEWDEIYCHSQTYMARNPTDHSWGNWDATVGVNMEQARTWALHLECPQRGHSLACTLIKGWVVCCRPHTGTVPLFLWSFPVLPLEDVIRKWFCVRWSAFSLPSAHWIFTQFF